MNFNKTRPTNTCGPTRKLTDQILLYHFKDKRTGFALSLYYKTQRSLTSVDFALGYYCYCCHKGFDIFKNQFYILIRVGGRHW